MRLAKKSVLGKQVGHFFVGRNWNPRRGARDVPYDDATGVGHGGFCWDPLLGGIQLDTNLEENFGRKFPNLAILRVTGDLKLG